MNIINFLGQDRLMKASYYSWLICLSLQIFNPFGAIRKISAAILLIALCFLWVKSHLYLKVNSSLTKISLVIFLWILAVSLFGPYPVISLNYFIKEFLVQAVIFIAGFVFIKTKENMVKVMCVIFFSFAAITFLSFGEVLLNWLESGFSLFPKKSPNSFYGGYGITASLLIPYSLALLLTGVVNSKKFIYCIFFTLLVAFPLLFFYASRSSILTTLAGILFLLIILKKWRFLLSFVGFVVCFFIVLQNSSLGHLDRYRSLLKGDTYVTDSGLSARLSVWQGTLDVIAERPLTGYGYGWKKLATVINENGFYEKWKDKSTVLSFYFRNGKSAYSSANPHNYILQVLFEIGLVGLSLSILFWITLFSMSMRGIKNKDDTEKRISIVFSVLLVSYFLANIANGYWSGGFINMISSLVGGIALLHKNKEINQNVAQV